MPREFRGLAVMACVAVLGACSEDLGSGAACPALCPEQSAAVRDTTLFPLLLDSGVVGFPPIGAELELLVAQRGDSLQALAVLRYDTLVTVFPKTSTDTTTKPVVGVDSASLLLQVSGRISKDSVTIEVYDVDTVAGNLDADAARPLFRPDRLLASRTFASDSVAGTLRITLPAAFVDSRITTKGRIRLGVKATSDSSVQVRFFSSNGGASPILTYRGRSARDTPSARDTAIFAVAVNSVSAAPGEASSADLADYSLISGSLEPAPPATFSVGGLPGSRAFLRFSLPSAIVDSTTVVRATLILTQAPYRGVAQSDTVLVISRFVVAAPFVEAGKAALLLADPRSVILPSLALVPADSGVRRFEIVNALRRWRFEDSTLTQRAIVLQSSGEGVLPQIVYFFSSEAPVHSLRPQLRLSYVPRSSSGLP